MILYFGNSFFGPHENLTLVQGDIRDAALIEKSAADHDIFISLACISNDASFELDEDLSTSVNLDAFEPMVIASKTLVANVYLCVLSSVYGVSEQVTEDHPCTFNTQQI